MKCDTQYKSCSIKCLPTLKTWTLSKNSLNLGVFLNASLFANMNYLIWRLSKVSDLSFIHDFGIYLEGQN